MEITIEKIKVFLLSIIALCLLLLTINVLFGEVQVFVRGGDVDVRGEVSVSDGSITVDGCVSVDNMPDFDY